MRNKKSQHFSEIASGQRFEFGKNWQRFLSVLDDTRVVEAEKSLQEMLKESRLDGKSFLDIGSGSGLFSLAAVRLGARVHSIDYDPQSVACTRYLKESWAPKADWVVEEGSVLERADLEHIGQFDVVYSWGVLHHTGAMWSAMGNVIPLVRAEGKLILGIYNDQGAVSRRWKAIKRLYNRAPRVLKPFILVPIMCFAEGRVMLGRVLRGQNPFGEWMQVKGRRGMSKWYDWIDWIGGYPFEVAKPEEVFEFFRDRGFGLITMRTQAGSIGCNEFVFLKSANFPNE